MSEVALVRDKDWTGGGVVRNLGMGKLGREEMVLPIDDTGVFGVTTAGF